MATNKSRTFVVLRNEDAPKYKLVIPTSIIAEFSKAINSRKGTELLIEQILATWQMHIGFPGYFTVKDKTNDKMFTYRIDYSDNPNYNLKVIETEDAITINLFDNKQFDFEIKEIDLPISDYVSEIDDMFKNC